MEKAYNVQILAQDGTTAIRTIPAKQIKNPPSFRSQINGGFGECVLDVNLPFDDFEEGSVIDFMRIVDIYCVDAANPRGRRIYRGFISQYEPYLEANGEGVRVTLLGLVSLLSFSHYKNGSSFSVADVGNDPEAIARSILIHFATIYGGSLITYTDDTTDPVGQAVNVDFVDKT